MPNSFTPTDAREVLANGYGASKEAASEEACLTAFATLLCRELSQVVLRPPHWQISLDDLMAEVNGILLREGQALPVHERRMLGGATGDAMGAAARDAEGSRLLRSCLDTHGGSFNPAAICHRSLGKEMAKRPRVHQELGGLLHKGGLKRFID